jgi:hypothetical protein
LIGLPFFGNPNYQASENTRSKISKKLAPDHFYTHRVYTLLLLTPIPLYLPYKGESKEHYFFTRGKGGFYRG